MIVNIRQWRELIPLTQAQVQMYTMQDGNPVSITTISNMENGERISRLKIQAVLHVLNRELLKKNLIERPLQIEDIEELDVA